jgi:hypothetical protein
MRNSVTILEVVSESAHLKFFGFEKCGMGFGCRLGQSGGLLYSCQEHFWERYTDPEIGGKSKRRFSDTIEESYHRVR